MRILISLFLLLSLSTQAQKITGSKVWLTTIEKDTLKIEYRVVQMGTLNDRLCVDVGWIFCLYELKNVSQDNYLVRDLTMMGKNAIGERYTIRQVIGDYGFVMWITNVDKGFPHWMITTQEPPEAK